MPVSSTSTAARRRIRAAALPCSPAGGDAFADFLLGYPSSVGRAYPGDNFGGQRWYYQFFGQDDIRVNGRLTVNIGLRYEYSPWLDGYKGQLGTFDPTQARPIIVASHTDKVDLSSQASAPAAYQFFGKYIQTSTEAHLPYSITYTDRTQFAPRIGFRGGPRAIRRSFAAVTASSTSRREQAGA